MRALASLLLLVPAIARGGDFASTCATLFADKVDAKACTNSDPKKCVGASDINKLKSALMDLCAAIQPVALADACPSGVYSQDAVSGKLRCLALPATPCSQLVWTGSEFACASPGVLWVNAFSPPSQTTPTTITLDGTNYLGASSVMSSAQCQGGSETGQQYTLTLDNGTDYIIRSSTKLRHPVKIAGGRTVRVIGLHIDPVTPKCTLNYPEGFVEGWVMLRLETVGSVFVEGLYIDQGGLNGDAITIRNLYDGGVNNGAGLDDGLTEAQARNGHDVTIVNSVVRGVKGNSALHGDFLQNQYVHEAFDDLRVENVSVDSTSQGFMLEPPAPTASPSAKIQLFATATIRNFDYRQDTRFASGTSGAAAFLSAASETYSEVYTYPTTGGYQGLGAWTHYPDPTQAFVYYTTVTAPSAGIKLNTRPAFRFATPGTALASDAWVGLNYASPF